MTEQQTRGGELCDDDGNIIREGQNVRVNAAYVGTVHFDDKGKFHVEGWPGNAVIQSLELIPTLPVDIDTVHPMIKE